MDDIRSLVDINPWIRLVKGAYKEPSTVAFPKLSQVNKNFIFVSKYLLEQIIKKEMRVAFGTHDLVIQEQVKNEAKKIGLQKEEIEFQMLYGIKSTEQVKLAVDGYKIRTLISYGEFWYPWYMRRLAERPANVGFVLQNVFNK
jgi:proline dehydrogenase